VANVGIADDADVDGLMTGVGMDVSTIRIIENDLLPAAAGKIV